MGGEQSLFFSGRFANGIVSRHNAYLEKRSTWVFVWYRLIMGVFLLIGVSAGFLRN